LSFYQFQLEQVFIKTSLLRLWWKWLFKDPELYLMDMLAYILRN